MTYKGCMLSTDGADLLTTKEVADALRVSTVTVTRWFNEGSLPGVKVGPRTFRFRRADVEARMRPEAVS